MSSLRGRHVLIIVENLSVPFDRRVWNEAVSLRDAGMKVSVICPRTRMDPVERETLDGIAVYRHWLPEASFPLAYLIEYLVALVAQVYWTVRIATRDHIDVIQGCNPPDTIFLVALLAKPFGTDFIFDHHDLSPELYVAKYRRKGLGYEVLKLLEGWTMKTATHCLARNESYRSIALGRGGMAPEAVTVVRSAPRFDLAGTRPTALDPEKRHIGYVGVIGAQEGLDLMLEAVRHVRRHREDVHWHVIGDGPARGSVQALSRELGISDDLTFYGRLPDDDLHAILAACDICVNPDRPSVLNDLSTMNKILEYMAHAKPIVQFDLHEGRVSAGPSSLYAGDGDPACFAACVLELLENPEKAARMGELGRQRLQQGLTWEHSEQELLRAYERVLARRS